MNDVSVSFADSVTAAMDDLNRASTMPLAVMLALLLRIDLSFESALLKPGSGDGCELIEMRSLLSSGCVTQVYMFESLALIDFSEDVFTRFCDPLSNVLISVSSSFV